MRAYIATGDFTRFLADKPLMEIPYPDPARLAGLLDEPGIRSVLPDDVRAPLCCTPVASAAGGDGREAFVPGGMSPDTTGAPAFRAVWGSFAATGAATVGSALLRFKTPVTLPYLKLEFAGDLGDPALRFALWDGQSGQQFRHEPSRPAGEPWQVEYLATHGHSSGIAVEDHSAVHWFAFSEPVEVGRLSYWTRLVLRCGGVVFVAGCLGLSVSVAADGYFVYARNFDRSRLEDRFTRAV